MIGAAVLVIGLLLVLAGLVSARLPGEAVFASPGSARPGTATELSIGPIPLGGSIRTTIVAVLLAPIHAATWRANAAIVIGFFVEVTAFSILASLFSAGVPLVFAGVGVLLFAIAIEGARIVARIERWRASIADPTPLRAHSYRALKGSVRDIAMAEFADQSRWRDVLYVAVNVPLAMTELVVAGGIWTLALGLLTMPVWYDASPGASLAPALAWLGGHEPAIVAARALAGLVLLPVAASVSQLLMALQRAVVSGLLCTSETRELQERVETLRESRSAVLDVEASELRRIERDLHDGAQQRLVMLTIDLGLASERIDTDPEAARRLVLEGREQARQALAEIRDLVRGIAPAILLDRGLVPALSSLAARSPVPTVVVSELPEGQRLPDAVERAAYFVVAEALANVAKHSSAGRCEVRCRSEGSPAGVDGRNGSGFARGRLVVEVTDDGMGGATISPGGGLAGLIGRVEALDGVLSLSSPPGGPTVLRAELPVGTPAAAARPPQIEGWRPAQAPRSATTRDM